MNGLGEDGSITRTTGIAINLASNAYTYGPVVGTAITFAEGLIGHFFGDNTPLPQMPWTQADHDASVQSIINNAVGRGDVDPITGLTTAQLLANDPNDVYANAQVYADKQSMWIDYVNATYWPQLGLPPSTDLRWGTYDAKGNPLGPAYAGGEEGYEIMAAIHTAQVGYYSRQQQQAMQAAINAAAAAPAPTAATSSAATHSSAAPLLLGGLLLLLLL